MSDHILSCDTSPGADNVKGETDLADNQVDDLDRPLRDVVTDEHPCTLEDIQALLVQSLRFTATAEGEARYYIDACDYDSRDIDEYYCDNCYAYWTIGEEYNTRSAAWQAVCDHLSELKGTA